MLPRAMMLEAALKSLTDAASEVADGMSVSSGLFGSLALYDNWWDFIYLKGGALALALNPKIVLWTLDSGLPLPSFNRIVSNKLLIKAKLLLIL